MLVEVTAAHSANQARPTESTTGANSDEDSICCVGISEQLEKLVEKNSQGGYPHAMLGNEEREKGGKGKEGERERE